MTIDRTTMMSLHIDGVLKGIPIDISSTSSINLNLSTDNFYIGFYSSSNGQNPFVFLNGNVGHALIYNRVLSATEVTNNFNAL